MRNIETLTTKTGPDDAGLNLLLTEARLEERRARAEAMAARLDSLACHITSRQLNHVEAAELLRVTAEAIQNEAQEIHSWLMQWISYSSALKKNASAIFVLPVPKHRACLACFALSVKRQFRQHAAVPFRVYSFALPARKLQS